MKKVLVTYPDGTSRETTVSELRTFFKEETKQWQANFFELLEGTGIADSNYARYTIVELPTVNRDNAMTARKFQHKTSKNKKGIAHEVRRNGQTKTWKTRPTHFSIPVKFGLRDCFYITNDNCHEWLVLY